MTMVEAEVHVLAENETGEPYPRELRQEMERRLASLAGHVFTSRSEFHTTVSAGHNRVYTRVTYHVALRSLKDFCALIHEVEWIAEAFEQPSLEFSFGGMVDRLDR